MIEVLRLGHRAHRDYRLSTHVALTARAFGASKIYYSGQEDGSLEESINKVVKKHGGSFSIEYVKSYKKLFNGRIIVHLTIKGDDFEDKVIELKKKNNLLIVVGGQKVPAEVYKLSDYNLSVTKEPHSEVSALGVFLDNLKR